MATREQLIEDFADHKYATGEKFARLINSMKVVQEPVETPAASGTSLSFIDSIEQDKDGKITATKKTLDLANAHELNPFKGWWKTGDTLPTSGFDGAYLYFKDTTQTPAVTTIYRWNGTAYADTGTEVDESNVQMFATGQAVNEVHIKDENGEDDPNAQGVLSAEAGKELNEMISGYNEDQENLIADGIIEDHCYNTNFDPMPNAAAPLQDAACIRIEVGEGDRFKLSTKGNDIHVRAWVFTDSERNVISGATDGISGGKVYTDIELTAPVDSYYLYVNTLDKINNPIVLKKIVSEHVDGLNERVEDLENKSEPKFASQQVLSNVSIIDNCHSDSSNDVLSSKQGKLLSEQINGKSEYQVIVTDYWDDKYTNGSLNVIGVPPTGTFAGCRVSIVGNVAGRKFRITGKGNYNNYTPLVVWAKEDKTIISVVQGNHRTEPYNATPPENAYYMAVNMIDYDSSIDKIEEYLNDGTGIKFKLESLLESLDDLTLPLKGKKVIFFGDSITQFSGAVPSIPNVFAKISGATCLKAAVGGTRLVPRKTSVDTPTSNAEAYAALDISNMITAWVSGDVTKQRAAANYINTHDGEPSHNYSAMVDVIENNDVADVDIVMIGGGTNDISSNVTIGTPNDSVNTTILGAISQIITDLLTANPKLKIYFYSPIVSGNPSNAWSDDVILSSGKTKPEYIELMANQAKRYHIPYIDLYWSLGWNKVNMSYYFSLGSRSDYVHPYNGFDVIARRLYRQVLSLIE